MKPERNLNRNSSSEQKKDAAEGIFENFSNFLFEKVNLLVNPGFSTSNGVTSTTTYNTAIRVPDTSGGAYLKINRESRFRCLFYIFGTAEKADGYLLSPVVYQSTTSISSGITSPSIFGFYVGIKFLAGRVWLCSFSEGQETLKDTGLRLIGESTYKLEIIYNKTSADIFVGDEFLGTVECDPSSFYNNTVTFYPLMGIIKSTDGTSVELTLENYQYIQDK